MFFALFTFFYIILQRCKIPNYCFHQNKFIKNYFIVFLLDDTFLLGFQKIKDFA